MIEIVVEDKKWHWYNLDRGVYKAAKDNNGKIVGKLHDRKKESKDGFPNAVEVLSNVKQAAKYIDKMNEEIMSTSSAVDMNPTGKPKKKKREIFNVSDECFHKFRHGKTKFERWSRYLDLEDASQKKIYDWAKRHHNGTIILQNSVTGQVRGIRYNRTGGGKWGSITRLKEQVLKTNQEFTVK